MSHNYMRSSFRIDILTPGTHPPIWNNHLQLDGAEAIPTPNLARMRVPHSQTSKDAGYGEDGCVACRKSVCWRRVARDPTPIARTCFGAGRCSRISQLWHQQVWCDLMCTLAVTILFRGHANHSRITGRWVMTMGHDDGS